MYNPLCYGNAAALVWRNICGDDDLGMNMEYCEVYDNVTSTLDYQMRIYDWPFRATIQIQRGSHGEGPGEDGYNHVEINNCTITDNQIISQSYGPSDCYINTAVGIIRHTDENHLLGTINNNIVYINTAGSSLLDQDVSLIHQLYGGFYDQGTFNQIRIPIISCCVNDAQNTVLYLDENEGSIDMDPMFVDAENHDYSLRWDVSAISPCIDRGNPSILDDIDGSPCEIGARAYQIAHDYERYAMPRVTSRETIKWMCYPVLNDITWGSCVNESFFEPIVDEQILEFVMYKPHLSSGVHEMRYVEGVLEYGNEIVLNTQGYKVKLQDDFLTTTYIHSPGTLIPPETVVHLHNRFDYEENWVGYFVRESAKPLDALASVLDQLSIIETAKWTMYKLADGSWLHGEKFILNYGDLVILYSDEDCSFVWNNPDPVPPLTLGTPIAFSYTEKTSYTSFFITLPSAKNGELPAEIGLYVNDECKGAVVVEDSLLHICAYLDDGEVITPDNSYLVFHYTGTKSGPTNKSIYRMSSKQLRQSKSPTNFYQISISDPQNCSPVSPIAILSQNYPNPFNPSTTISYELPVDGSVQISIYNLKGQLVKHLLNKHESIGPHSVVWDGKDSSGRACSSGMYYYRLTSFGKSISKKMLLLK
ncbi:MAG: T9SS type A sorting domain-containing protein [Candidatus Cloacimonetes bacterium]|nr:T9SS type A sorting domain-containing protein [Candidatus Cloacimonadota bacterium]